VHRNVRIANRWYVLPFVQNAAQPTVLFSVLFYRQSSVSFYLLAIHFFNSRLRSQPYNSTAKEYIKIPRFLTPCNGGTGWLRYGMG
jgi:hypothetical protein